jgi:hypothetical protein
MNEITTLPGKKNPPETLPPDRYEGPVLSPEVAPSIAAYCDLRVHRSLAAYAFRTHLTMKVLSPRPAAASDFISSMLAPLAGQKPPPMAGLKAPT